MPKPTDPHQGVPELRPTGTLEGGLPPGTPWHHWGGPQLSPKLQPDPVRVGPMMETRFQPPTPHPGLRPGHKLRTQGGRDSGWEKGLLHSRHWSCLLSLDLLLWPNPRLSSQSRGSRVTLSPRISLPLLCQFGNLTLEHSFLIMPQCPMVLLGRDLLPKFGVSITIRPLNVVSVLHADGTWTLRIPYS